MLYNHIICLAFPPDLHLYKDGNQSSYTDNMENRRQKSSSGDKFSFPIMGMPEKEPEDGEFEFGCISTSPEASPNSPADRLFFNGKLMPHNFPTSRQPAAVTDGFSYSRSTSSVSSGKESMMSSRSNSGSSSGGSARTSGSGESAFNINIRRLAIININNRSKWAHSSSRPLPSSKPHLLPASKKSQFMAAPAHGPVHLWNKRPGSLSLGKGHNSQEVKVMKQGDQQQSDGEGRGSPPWFGRRVLRSIVSSCKECHAIPPTTKQAKDIVISTI
ncbi:unnamed protein product [Cuscuta europaea]|uniref:Uncharacterized protein n=1 Tax=Cuscuta europaea TaxID=41803 RepID=A0A9P0ZPQ8_CUSEU|nr:unnamed protein product [Cuscuta europaea]